MCKRSEYQQDNNIIKISIQCFILFLCVDKTIMGGVEGFKKKKEENPII